MLKRSSVCWFGPNLPEKRNNCNHWEHEPTPIIGLWKAYVDQEISTEKCVLWERLTESVAKKAPDPIQRRLWNEAYRQRGSNCWCRKKRNCQKRYCMRQAVFQPLILGIYFRKSESSDGNLTIACTDVSRLHPGVPAGWQLGSWAEAAKTHT